MGSGKVKSHWEGGSFPAKSHANIKNLFTNKIFDIQKYFYSVKASCLGFITVCITLKYLNFSVLGLWKELGLQQLMIETTTCINVDISDGKRIKSNVKFPQIT